MIRIKSILLIAAFILLFPLYAESVRIKDIASIDGIRENQLLGYGLVVGLNGTGDKNPLKLSTIQLLSNILLCYNSCLVISVHSHRLETQATTVLALTISFIPFIVAGLGIYKPLLSRIFLARVRYSLD